jgi:proteasome accessory factor B
LNTGVRTVYRDLATLQEVGFPFTSEKNNGITRYILIDRPAIIHHLNFGPSELLALYLSQGILSQLRGTLFQEAMDRLMEKVSAVLPAQTQQYFRDLETNIIIELFNRRDYRKKAKEIQAILSCLRDKKVLAMNYFSPNRGELEREVDPYHLWVMGDSLYLIGFCHLNQEIRTFLVDRINSAVPTKKSFKLRAGFDFRKYSQDNLGIMRSGEAEDFEFRFAPEVAYLIKERKWHPSQKLKVNPDRSITLAFRAKGIEEIKRWILSFGEFAQVIKPDKLRKQIKDTCQRMLKNSG